MMKFEDKFSLPLEWISKGKKASSAKVKKEKKEEKAPTTH